LSTTLNFLKAFLLRGRALFRRIANVGWCEI